MKSVICEAPRTGYPVVAVFTEDLSHVMIAAVMRKEIRCLPSSAGFVYKSDGKWVVSKETSESLGGLGPAPQDQQLLNYFLDDGLTGLDLQNRLAYDTLQARKK